MDFEFVGRGHRAPRVRRADIAVLGLPIDVLQETNLLDRGTVINTPYQQGDSYSCWIIVGTKLLENKYRLQYGELLPLSAQQAVDGIFMHFRPDENDNDHFKHANTDTRTGKYEEFFEYVGRVGLRHRDEYPGFTGRREPCRDFIDLPFTIRVYAEDWEILDPGVASEIKVLTCLMNDQAVGATVHNVQQFYDLKELIYRGPTVEDINAMPEAQRDRIMKQSVTIVGSVRFEGTLYYRIMNSRGNAFGVNGCCLIPASFVLCYVVLWGVGRRRRQGPMINPNPI